MRSRLSRIVRLVCSGMLLSTALCTCSVAQSEAASNWGEIGVEASHLQAVGRYSPAASKWAQAISMACSKSASRITLDHFCVPASVAIAHNLTRSAMLHLDTGDRFDDPAEYDAARDDIGRALDALTTGTALLDQANRAALYPDVLTAKADAFQVLSRVTSRNNAKSAQALLKRAVSVYGEATELRSKTLDERRMRTEGFTDQFWEEERRLLQAQHRTLTHARMAHEALGFESEGQIDAEYLSWRRRTLQQGLESVQKRDWPAAIATFDVRNGDPIFDYNRAVAEAKIPGNEAVAANTFIEYLVRAPNADNHAAIAEQISLLLDRTHSTIARLADMGQQIAPLFDFRGDNARRDKYVRELQRLQHGERPRCSRFSEWKDLLAGGNDYVTYITSPPPLYEFQSLSQASIQDLAAALMFDPDADLDSSLARYIKSSNIVEENLASLVQFRVLQAVTALHDFNDIEQARRYFTLAAEVCPAVKMQLPALLLAQAKQESDRGLAVDEITIASQLDQDPRKAPLYSISRAKAEVDAGLFREAADDLSQVSEAELDSIPADDRAIAHRTMARLLLVKGDYQAAAGEYAKAGGDQDRTDSVLAHYLAHEYKQALDDAAGRQGWRLAVVEYLAERGLHNSAEPARQHMLKSLEEDDPELRVAGDARIKTDILHLFIDEKAAVSLLSKGIDKRESEYDQNVCIADFYLAEYALLHNQPRTAKQFLESEVQRMPEDCGSHAEFMASLAALRRLQP